MADKVPTTTTEADKPLERSSSELPAGEQNAQELFADVFRRADKNDDGKLSLDEFCAYFGDNHLSKADLQYLFNSIDTDKSTNIDLKELHEYFRKGFDVYQALFESLENTHSAISNVLQHTNKTYFTLGFFEQFKIRFYLKEFLLQIEALHQPIDVAVQRLEEMTPSNVVPEQIPHSMPETDVSVGESKGLEKQVARLERLVNALSKAKITLETPDEAMGEGESDEAYTVVSQKYSVKSANNEGFMAALRTHLEATKAQDGCYHTFIKRIPGDTTIYYLYEVWTSADSLEDHHAAEYYKTFAKSLVDLCSAPAEFNKMEIPAEWWPHDDE